MMGERENASVTAVMGCDRTKIDNNLQEVLFCARLRITNYLVDIGDLMHHHFNQMRKFDW